MIIKTSIDLQNDYKSISKLAKEIEEPIFITRNGEVNLVVMSIETYERREKVLDLREELMLAEAQRITGVQTLSLDEVHQQLREKIKDKSAR